MGTPSQSYGTSLAAGSHSVTCHPTQVNARRLTPAMLAGTRFTDPGGMEGWVDLVDLIAPQQGVEQATFRSRVRRRTAAPPRQNYHFAPVSFCRGIILPRQQFWHCFLTLKWWTLLLSEACFTSKTSPKCFCHRALTALTPLGQLLQTPA